MFSNSLFAAAGMSSSKVSLLGRNGLAFLPTVGTSYMNNNQSTASRIDFTCIQARMILFISSTSSSNSNSGRSVAGAIAGTALSQGMRKIHRVFKIFLKVSSSNSDALLHINLMISLFRVDFVDDGIEDEGVFSCFFSVNVSSIFFKVDDEGVCPG